MAAHSKTRVVGLTGSIGTGKSAVAREFESLGAKIIDADLLAREVVEPGRPGLNELVAAFGETVLLADGSLDRRALGSIVFADKNKRLKLEQILHPKIRSLFLERLNLAKAKNPELIVYVVPLLFESKYEYPELEAVIVVSATPEQSIQRVMSRDKLSREEAQARLNAGLPIDLKAKQADYIIDNSGPPEALKQATKDLFIKLSA